MKDLFKAELLRFRTWAIAYAALHLGVLLFLSRIDDLAQEDPLVYQAFAAVYVLSGLLLGLYQFGSYRRPNAWLSLVHRPLPCPRIALALLGGAGALLALAVAVPMLLTLAYQATLTARVVDLRHELLPAAAVLLALCGYLAGAHAVLGGRRYAACALVVLAMLAQSRADGALALAFQALCLLWLAAMVVAVFKPDLSEPPRSLAATLLAALPMQMGVFLLLLLAGLGVEMAMVVVGTHPLNRPVPPPGGTTETDRMEGRARMLAGLVASRDPQASLWREQVALSEVTTSSLSYMERPHRGTLGNPMATTFGDRGRHVQWVFSHDRMRYEGLRDSDGRRVAELGVGTDGAAFPQPPVEAGTLPGLGKYDRMLTMDNVLYQYIGETGQVRPRVRLPAGEVIVSFGMIGENLTVGSDRARYFFDGRDLVEDEGLMHPRQRVAIPGAYAHLSATDIVELVDGYLLSFAFTDHDADPSGAAPRQMLLRVDDAGHVRQVGERAIRYDYPAWFRYRSWWVSPLMSGLRIGLRDAFERPDPLRAIEPPPVPRVAWLLAGMLSLLSLLAAVWVGARRQLSAPARWAWVAASGVVGLPALVCVAVLYRRRESPASLVRPADAQPQPA